MGSGQKRYHSKKSITERNKLLPHHCDHDAGRNTARGATRKTSRNGAGTRCSSWCTSTLSSALSNKSSISSYSSMLSASSIRPRPITGDHMLDWYIPRFVIDEDNADGRQNKNAKSSGLREKRFVPQNMNTISESQDEEEREEIIPSPLHDESKQEWLTNRTDNKVRSLPFPPPHKPKILRFSPTHAHNLSGLFNRALGEGGYPQQMYSRYGVPMVPLPVPPPLVPNYKPAIMAANARPWSSFYNAWNPRPTDPYYRHDDRILPPPPQSMFLFAGGPQRRHFSVAPDWRRIKHY